VTQRDGGSHAAPYGASLFSFLPPRDSHIDLRLIVYCRFRSFFIFALSVLAPSPLRFFTGVCG
jgi:hypothetical protein